MSYAIRNKGLEDYSTVREPDGAACDDDYIAQFLNDLTADHWRFHHPMFEYLERTISQWEIGHFIKAERHWLAAAGTGPSVHPRAPDALRFQELLDKMSIAHSGPIAAFAPSSRVDEQLRCPPPGTRTLAAFTLHGWAIVDTLADAYQYQKLLAAGRRLRLDAATTLAPGQNNLRNQIERITHLTDAHEGNSRDLVTCIELCQALRIDHYDRMLDDLMSLPAAV